MGPMAGKRHGRKLQKAADLVIERAIALMKSGGLSEGTCVKWNGTDEAGEKRTVEYSLSDIASAIEKLSRAAASEVSGDDPLVAFLRRLDDEAGTQ